MQHESKITEDPTFNLFTVTCTCGHRADHGTLQAAQSDVVDHRGQIRQADHVEPVQDDLERLVALNEQLTELRAQAEQVQGRRDALMRRLHHDGASVTRMAERLGMQRTYVHTILTGTGAKGKKTT